MFLCKWRARNQISLHRDNKVVLYCNSNPVFGIPLQFTVMHHHTKVGLKRFRSSENIFLTNQHTWADREWFKSPPTLFRGITSISDRSDFLAVWTVISKPHCTAIPTPHVQAKTATGHLHVATFYNRALTWTSADPRKLKLNISWAISLGDKK